MELIKNHAYVKAKPLSASAAELIEEVNEIKKAFKDLEKVKAGKLKTRPSSELLNEL